MPNATLSSFYSQATCLLWFKIKGQTNSKGSTWSHMVSLKASCKIMETSLAYRAHVARWNLCMHLPYLHTRNSAFLWDLNCFLWQGILHFLDILSFRILGYSAMPCIRIFPHSTTQPFHHSIELTKSCIFYSHVKLKIIFSVHNC